MEVKILEHFDNKGKKRCSERGGGDYLSSPPIMETKKKMLSEKDLMLVTLYSVVFNSRKSNTFQFIMMSVLCTDLGV